MHYYQRHIGDYRRDTSTLTATEHGVYVLLMDEYYVTERPLPADINALYRICRAMTRAEKLAVALVAEKFFRVEDGALRHKRIDGEIIGYRALSEKRSRGGKRSAEVRQQKENTSSTHVEHVQEDSLSKTRSNHEPVTSNQSLSYERDALAPEVLPKGCRKQQPQGWPKSESQAREMAEMAGVNADLAGTFWHHYDGMGYWPQGSFVSAMKAKQGFKVQDLADKEQVERARFPKPQAEEGGWTHTR